MANIPEQVQTLLDQYLEQVRTDPEHSLSGEDRGRIYKSFGRSRFTHPKYYNDSDGYNDWLLNEEPTNQPTKNKPKNKPLQKIKKALKSQTTSDYILGWIAILTAKYVLPIWENTNLNTIFSNTEYIISPNEIIEVAEQIISGSGDIERAYRDLNEEYYYCLNIGHFTQFDLAAVCASALYTIIVVLLGANNLDKFNPAMSEAKITLERDCILQSARAYTVIDKNKPGKWMEFENKTSKPSGITFDADKRLEFWEWWLTEAIPQAWELAQASTPKPKQ